MKLLPLYGGYSDKQLNNLILSVVASPLRGLFYIRVKGVHWFTSCFPVMGVILSLAHEFSKLAELFPVIGIILRHGGRVHRSGCYFPVGLFPNKIKLSGWKRQLLPRYRGYSFMKMPDYFDLHVVSPLWGLFSGVSSRCK